MKASDAKWASALSIGQDCIRRAPMLVLGSGASAAYGIPGMPQLRDHLKAHPMPFADGTAEHASWKELLAKLDSTDLESALTDVRLTAALTTEVVKATWDYLSPYDLKVLHAYLDKRDIFPLERFIRHFFNSTHTELHVLTPNYDRLVEYATDAAGFTHYTGFTYGHVRSRADGFEPRVHNGSKVARTVKIWKVHGSFDWFRDSGGNVIGLPAMERRPSAWQPVIVTPGIEKYRQTYEEPFLSIKQGSDQALRSARSYLCIGYGFNDEHIQTKLVEQCQTRQVPLVLITKVISSTAKDFLKSGKCTQYLALEESPGGTMAYTHEHPSGFEVKGQAYWQLDQFLNLVLA
jgi:hypothetical protein